MRRAVLHPFTGMRDNRLSGLHVQRAASMGDAQDTFEHHGEFVELRFLTRFYPAAWTSHVSHAQTCFAIVHPSDEFIDELGFVSGCGNARRV
jgi:hypothetical protein